MTKPWQLYHRLTPPPALQKLVMASNEMIILRVHHRFVDDKIETRRRQKITNAFQGLNIAWSPKELWPPPVFLLSQQ